MEFPVWLGSGLWVPGRRKQLPGGTGDGLNATLRDQFTTAVDPLVDGAAEPGAGSTGGTRTVTGSLWAIIDGSLRKGYQQASPTWGNSKITYDSQARADGVALWALVKASDKDADLGIGWASATTVTDPTTNGHHWINSGGYPRVSMPGTLVSLSGIDVGKIAIIRNTEFLVCVVLRSQGAFYLISSFAAHTRTGVAASNDYIGIPQYPSARVLWVDDSTTTTPMYPHIGALDANGAAQEHFIDDLRVKTISSWATDAGIAASLDRMTRADSAASMGPDWTNVAGTFGVSGNKGYVVSNTGTNNIAVRESGLTGDGIWQVKVTIPTTVSDDWGIVVRYIDASNFVLVANTGGGTAIQLTKVVGGAGTNIQNYPVAWVAGQTYTITVITKGNMYQILVDGVLLIDWISDSAGSTFLTASKWGIRTWNTLATGARWDDWLAVPSIVTLPADIQIGEVPHIYTVGSTIATDEFTAANGTAINGRTTTTGAKTWTTVGAGWEINSNKARNTNVNGAATEYFAYIDAGVADYELTVDLTTPAAGNMIRAGFMLRRLDANNYIYARVFLDDVSQPGNDEIEIWEVVGGVTGSTCKGQYGNLWVFATTYAVKVQVVGRMMHMLVNGEPMISYVTVGTGGTGVGLYHSGDDDGSSFDNFTVKALS